MREVSDDDFFTFYFTSLHFTSSSVTKISSASCVLVVDKSSHSLCDVTCLPRGDGVSVVTADDENRPYHLSSPWSQLTGLSHVLESVTTE